jgi:hypothetical protein
MNRTEKIDAVVDFLDDNHIKIIDTETIGAVIIDAEQTLNEEDNEYEYDELREKGLTDDDIESFKRFLEKNTLMMIKIDDISGVSFENVIYEVDGLYETDLLSNKEEEGKKCEDKNTFLSANSRTTSR